MIIVKCPKCLHDMNYDPRHGQISDKIKRCVYCGHSFKVHSDQMKSRIVRVVK